MYGSMTTINGVLSYVCLVISSSSWCCSGTYSAPEHVETSVHQYFPFTYMREHGAVVHVSPVLHVWGHSFLVNVVDDMDAKVLRMADGVAAAVEDEANCAFCPCCRCSCRTRCASCVALAAAVHGVACANAIHDVAGAVAVACTAAVLLPLYALCCSMR